MVKRKSLLASCVLVVVCLAHTAASAGSTFSMNDTTLVTNDSLVVLTDEFFAGRMQALKILFTRERLTDEERRESVRTNAPALRNRDLVFLVLFLDKANGISQANLTVVVPGQTVTRTVAWRPDDLKDFSSQYAYDGTRLRLRHKGRFQDPSSERTPFRLTWDVDIDAPVVEHLGAGKK